MEPQVEQSARRELPDGGDLISFHFMFQAEFCRSGRQGRASCAGYLLGRLPRVAQKTVKNLPTMEETRVQSMGQEDPLEKGMATHSSILAWRIPWTEEPGRLPSMGCQT